MNESPLVSVIIPTYNQSAMLVEAVESVMAQTYRPIEIVVVDDGSTDDTATRMRPYAQSSAVRYLFQPNRRQAAARNAGIAASAGELIAFLDHDDLWAPDKLARQVPLFVRPQVALVYCGAQEVNLDGKRLWIKGIEKYRRGKIFEHLLFDHFITNSSVIVRRSCLDRSGTFREDLFGVDDIHLWLRICHDYDVDFVPDILVSCRNHQGNMKKDSNSIPEKRYLALDDIFRRFGLDRTERMKWRALHADYHFNRGCHCRIDRRGTAMLCYLKSFHYQPRWRCIKAVAALLIPARFTTAELVKRSSDVRR